MASMKTIFSVTNDGSNKDEWDRLFSITRREYHYNENFSAKFRVLGDSYHQRRYAIRITNEKSALNRVSRDILLSPTDAHTLNDAKRCAINIIENMIVKQNEKPVPVITVVENTKIRSEIKPFSA